MAGFAILQHARIHSLRVIVVQSASRGELGGTLACTVDIVDPGLARCRPTAAVYRIRRMARRAHRDAVVAGMEVRSSPKPVMASVACAFTENYPPRNVRLAIRGITGRRHHCRDAGNRTSEIRHAVLGPAILEYGCDHL